MFKGSPDRKPIPIIDPATVVVGVRYNQKDRETRMIIWIMNNNEKISVKKLSAKEFACELLSLLFPKKIAEEMADRYMKEFEFYHYGITDIKVVMERFEKFLKELLLYEITLFIKKIEKVLILGIIFFKYINALMKTRFCDEKFVKIRLISMLPYH